MSVRSVVGIVPAGAGGMPGAEAVNRVGCALGFDAASLPVDDAIAKRAVHTN